MSRTGFPVLHAGMRVKVAVSTNRLVLGLSYTSVVDTVLFEKKNKGHNILPWGTPH